jgi:hypothetical protein
VVIPARRHWPVLLLLAVWLTGWFFGETSALQRLLHPHERDGRGFMAFWLVGWTIGGALAASAFVWMLLGREVIVMDGRVLSLRSELLGLPLGRERRYALSDVKDLRCSPLAQLPRSRRSVGLIAFDYGAKTIRFAADVDEAEAKMIVSRLTARTPWRR